MNYNSVFKEEIISYIKYKKSNGYSFNSEIVKLRNFDKYLVENNFVEAVIQLPSDLFFGTSIATCILVLKRSKTDNSILFVDASNEFLRGDSKNKLTDKNIENIVNLLRKRENKEYKSILVSNEEILENDCNISVNSYLKQDSAEEKIDIKELNKEVEEIVKRENVLRVELDKIIKELEVVYSE